MTEVDFLTADELRSIEAMARRRARPSVEADDLRQEALIEAWRVRDADPGASSALVVHAARMAMAQAWRRSVGWSAGPAAARMRWIERAPDARPAVPPLDAMGLRVAVDETLPPREAEAVRLRYFAGLGERESAAEMGMSVAWVAQRCRRALGVLHRALGPSYADEYGRSVPLRDPDSYHLRARRSGPNAAVRKPRRHDPAARARAEAAKYSVIDAARDMEP